MGQEQYLVERRNDGAVLVRACARAQRGAKHCQRPFFVFNRAIRNLIIGRSGSATNSANGANVVVMSRNDE